MVLIKDRFELLENFNSESPNFAFGYQMRAFPKYHVSG